ncbi:hypothetical protein [Mucilaginibacter sp. SG564]|nr:hypothetical protein [Mucilaginibacter sp. SG564]NOW97569.1 hypothetical protein [Mucilaginibacter sp. SG564]
MQIFLSQVFEHLVQWFILLLQHGVLALAIDVVPKDEIITIAMKRNFFMI